MRTYEITYIFTIDVQDDESPEDAASQYLAQEHTNMEPSSVVPLDEESP